MIDAFVLQEYSVEVTMAYRILLVEDERQIREAITDYFTGREDGYELTCAGDGTEGLRKLQEKEYDLVLLDVMLPGMDGFTMMKTLRRDQEVPVIFINRELGTSKMNSSIFGEAVFGVIQLKWDSWFRQFPQKRQQGSQKRQQGSPDKNNN